MCCTMYGKKRKRNKKGHHQQVCALCATRKVILLCVTDSMYHRIHNICNVNVSTSHTIVISIVQVELGIILHLSIILAGWLAGRLPITYWTPAATVPKFIKQTHQFVRTFSIFHIFTSFQWYQIIMLQHVFIFTIR